jgi:hypothetical protein
MRTAVAAVALAIVGLVLLKLVQWLDLYFVSLG